MALPALQMPPGRAAPGLAASRGDHPHLPPLWQAYPHLCLTRSRRQNARGGTMAALFCLWLEWGQGLCRRYQYRALRRCLSQALASLTPITTRRSSDHDTERSQLGVVYRVRAGATVAANVPSGPPDLLRKDVRQWLGQICDVAFCAATRSHASLVWIATACSRLIYLDVLLSNGTK